MKLKLLLNSEKEVLLSKKKNCRRIQTTQTSRYPIVLTLKRLPRSLKTLLFERLDSLQTFNRTSTCIIKENLRFVVYLNFETPSTETSNYTWNNRLRFYMRNKKLDDNPH